MSEVSHRLRITPTDSGYWVVSNDRVLFFSGAMLNELFVAVSHVMTYNTEYRNYEEPPRKPLQPSSLPASPRKKPTLDDLL